MKRSPTVIEMMIVTTIIGIVFAMLAGTFSGQGCAFQKEQKANADVEARTWIAAMYPEVPSDQTHVLCQGSDTDGNGYVTCSARIGTEHVNLECYAYVMFNLGDNTCREITILRGGQGGIR